VDTDRVGGSAQRVEILMVDDDLGDIEFTRDVLAEHRIANRMTVLTDGNSAWHYLRRDPPFAEAVRPDLLLLDLNLPGIDGLTLLDLIRADDALRDLKVAVLTTAPIDESILRRRGVPAHCYLLKPVDFERLVEVVVQIDEFHLRVERLP
jgi:CheY-like chemotaxis protein